MKIIIFLTFLVLGFFLYKNLSTPKNIGVQNQKLSPCSWTPNCVNSNATKEPYKIKPLPCISEDCLSLIEEFLLNNYKTKVVKKTSTYLYVVVTSPILHFKDDLEFLIEPGKHSISVRSSSRVGYSDFNVNRKRIESIRHFLNLIKDTQKNKA